MEEELPTADRKKKRDIKLGQNVLVFNQSPKKLLESTWISGYRVTRLIGGDAYEVSNKRGKHRLDKIHAKRDTGN